MAKAKLTNVLGSRRDPRRLPAGRRAVSRLPVKEPRIGQLVLKQGKAVYITPEFYKRFQARIDAFVANGALRLEVPPSQRTEWDAEVAAAATESPAEATLRAANEQILREAEATGKELRKRELRRAFEAAEAAVKQHRTAARDKPDVDAARTSALAALDLLSNVPPIDMSDEQLARMQAHQLPELELADASELAGDEAADNELERAPAELDDELDEGEEVDAEEEDVDGDDGDDAEAAPTDTTAHQEGVKLPGPPVQLPQADEEQRLNRRRRRKSSTRKKSSED